MYLAIEGVIGVGKTTLARLLSPAFQAETLLEIFEENPFLSKFYGDRARYAFQTQMFFLLSRFQQQKRAIPPCLAEGKTLISDYIFEKDALFARLNLEGDELEMYNRIQAALAEQIPLPDLTVYLRADTETLMQRIAMRDRSYERNMDRAYIAELNQAYDALFLAPSRSGVTLVIETDLLDFVRKPGDLRLVEDRIRQTLHLSPYQPELPLTPA